MDERLQATVERALERLGRKLVIGLPLGLGKPNELVNAFYRRAKADPSLELEIVTALSLDLPEPASELERRLMRPFVERHFGSDYPRLEYARDLRRTHLPGNVRVCEFYVRSGAGLGNPLVQRHHISSNYTHVARDLVDRGINLVLQLVAERGVGPDRRYSLSSNPDVTLDLVRRSAREPGRDLLVIGQVHPDLPFMHGDAVVGEEFFDEVLPAGAPHRLFALPRLPVSLQEHWVGLHASTLVADAGTLQIGIGALSDALVHALILRHEHNARYRSIVASGSTLDGESATRRVGGLDPFDHGLYGASEMFMDGFMHLYRAGILKREVFEDIEAQKRANAGRSHETPALAGTGAIMDAAFLLGSRPFYEFLRGLDDAERPRFRMTSVSRINQLYGGSEELEVLQRRRARFFNTCMMTTATGAAVSDALEDQQVVSGVGGQYNFVAMAHAMEDGRSVLMSRSTRESGGKTKSNVVWEYPHATIPRHLRDLVVTEYGVADLRGRTDEECIRAMVGICDARFQGPLVAEAKSAGKLDRRWEVPERARGNTPERLRELLSGEREVGRFPDYPFGSDFTEVERRLIGALRRLEALSRNKLRLLAAAARGRPADFPEELERMGLDRPASPKERLHARLLAATLAGGRRDEDRRPRGAAGAG